MRHLRELLRAGAASQAIVVGNGLEFLCREVLLRGAPFSPAPFLCRNEAHARAKTFVVARSLAGVLVHRVAAGPVPAGAQLSRLRRRNYRPAASRADRRLNVLQILSGHSSSPFACPRRQSSAPWVSRLLISHPQKPNAQASWEVPEFHGCLMRGMKLPLSCAYATVTTNHSRVIRSLRFYLIIHLVRSFILSAHPTSCIVETSSGISMRMTVPSPGRLSMSK